METTILLVIGLVAGTLSGFLGVGGATIMIPALVYIFKMSQHMAQGTALGAMLLPVGLLAALKYHQAGNLNIKFAAIIAIAFLVGGLIGATFVQPMPEAVLRKIFALFLLLIALQMLIWG